MKQKRIYNEAQLNVVRLSGKSQLLAGSEPGSSTPSPDGPSFTPVQNGAQRNSYQEVTGAFQ